MLFKNDTPKFGLGALVLAVLVSLIIGYLLGSLSWGYGPTGRWGMMGGFNLGYPVGAGANYGRAL